MTTSIGQIRVRRTATGYVAALRVQGVEVSGGCSYEDAERILGELPPEVAGFSFASLAHGIGQIASGIARSKALGSLVALAGALPPPVGTVVHMAGQAVNAIKGIASGHPAAKEAWDAAANVARADPNSPQAVALKLAMQAAGQPRWNDPAQAAMLADAGISQPTGPAPKGAPQTMPAQVPMTATPVAPDPSGAAPVTEADALPD